MNQTKNHYFEYVVFLLDKWRIERGIKTKAIFTKLRLQKLLFLISTIETKGNDSGLLDYFDNFYALPYGPVEIDIYSSMNKNRFQKVKFRGNFCEFNCLDENDFYDIPSTFKEKAETSITKLKSIGRNYLSMPVFDLVTLTHQWSAWRNAYTVATMLGSKSSPMTIEDIKSSAIKAF